MLSFALTYCKLWSLCRENWKLTFLTGVLRFPSSTLFYVTGFYWSFVTVPFGKLWKISQKFSKLACFFEDEYRSLLLECKNLGRKLCFFFHTVSYHIFTIFIHWDCNFTGRNKKKWPLWLNKKIIILVNVYLNWIV